MNKTFYELMDLPAISGHEKLVRDYMKNYINKYTNFTLQQDKLGSLFAVKKSKNPQAKKVMIAGHMDEIGFIVAGIEANGLIKLQAIGGILGEVFISQVLTIYTNCGRQIKGVVGSIPPHLRKTQQTNVEGLRLDIGANDRQQVLSWGVELGNMVLFANQFSFTPDKKRFISKAIDNRFGCGLALEVIKGFDQVELDFDLIVGATVQEEVGLRGAETAVNLLRPDIFLALDASPCTDINSSEAPSKLGAGFLLRIFDPRNIIHQGLLHYIKDLAKKKKIPYQYFTSLGGTDAAKTLDMHAGILSTTIGISARYIHSTAAIADIDDIKQAKNILFSILKDLDTTKIIKLQEANR